MPLPITILLPTRNSMQLLPGHVQALRELLPLVESVVHVDSQSQDGTVEFVRKNVPHSHFSSFDHPPGLYQSWNFGIQQVASKYVYISTVGDFIQPEGLERLFEVAGGLNADVAISIPAFQTTGGRTIEQRWPIHRIIDELQMKEPAALPSVVAFFLAVRNIPDAILNSSASNLYKTETLKAKPFPTQFGTAGDAGWGLAYALTSRLAIVPESFSTFLVHEKTYSLKDYHVEDVRSKMLRLAKEAAGLEEGRSRIARFFTKEQIDRLIHPHFEDIETAFELQRKLESYRHRGILRPWVVFPGAWKARAKRNRYKRRIAATHAKLVRLPLETLSTRASQQQSSRPSQ